MEQGVLPLKVLTITGYKPLELNIYQANDLKIDVIKETIKKKILSFLEEGLEWVLVSGQQGIETWAAEVCLELKQQYAFQLAVLPPFENQDSRWPEHARELYQEICEAADFFQPLYKSDYQGPYQFKAKNKWMVAKSDSCLVVLNEEYPGSNRFFLKEARAAEKQTGYFIHLITPLDLEDMFQEMQMNDPDNFN